MSTIERKNPVIPGRRCGKNEILTTVPCGKKSSALKLLKAFLSGYLKFIESPHRQDSILKTAQYSLWLLSKFYPNSGTKRDIPHRIAKSLLNLQGEISWARYLFRFFGLPAAINGVDLTKNDWATGNNSKRLGQVMSWTMVAYYPLEHLSYLFWKAPDIRWLPCALPTPVPTTYDVTSCQIRDHNRNSNRRFYSSTQLASKASAWSSRFWLAWLISDIVRCTLALRDIQQTPHSSGTKKTAPGANDDDLQQTDSLEQELTLHQYMDKQIPAVRTEHLQIIRNMLYILPAINWSLPDWDTQPWLSGDVVNGFCWLESVVGLHQGIRNFQHT